MEEAVDVEDRSDSADRMRPMVCCGGVDAEPGLGMDPDPVAVDGIWVWCTTAAGALLKPVRGAVASRDSDGRERDVAAVRPATGLNESSCTRLCEEFVWEEGMFAS